MMIDVVGRRCEVRRIANVSKNTLTAAELACPRLPIIAEDNDSKMDKVKSLPRLLAILIVPDTTGLIAHHELAA